METIKRLLFILCLAPCMVQGQTMGASQLKKDGVTIKGNASNQLQADTTVLATKYYVGTTGSGTVTSVTGGSGLTGGTITTSGTLKVDTSLIATRTYVTSGASVDTSKVPYTGATRNVNLGSKTLFTTGSIGATGTRVLKSWFTDLEVTNAPTLGGVAASGTGGLIRTTSPTFITDITTPKIITDNTTFANQNGIIYKGVGNSFIHDFNYGNNGTVTTTGGNLFVGSFSGNFTMGSTATTVNQSSFNSCFGWATGQSLTLGNFNNLFGYNSGKLLTSGSQNFLAGFSAGANMTTASGNINIGTNSGASNISGNTSVSIGNNSGKYETGSNAFYLNNIDQVNTADEKLYSLLYGNFGGTAQTQTGNYLKVNGTVNIGNAIANPTAYGQLRIGAGSSMVDIGDYGSGYSAIWINKGTNNLTNYQLAANTTDLFLNTPTNLFFQIGGTTKSQYTASYVTMAEGYNFALGTTTGTKIGTATTQKIAFWNSTPIVQPANTTTINDVLVNTGLMASGATTFKTSLPLSVGGTIIYMKDSVTPFHYWAGTMTSGVLIWTDTGSITQP